MDDVEWRWLMEEFDRDVIARFADTFAENEATLAHKSIEEFGTDIGTFATLMIEGLQKFLDTVACENVGMERRNDAFVLLALRLNEVLPETHPYCVGIVEYVRLVGPVRYALAAFRRTECPEFTTSEDPYAIPYYRTEEQQNPLVFSKN